MKQIIKEFAREMIIAVILLITLIFGLVANDDSFISITFLIGCAAVVCVIIFYHPTEVKNEDT